MEDILYDFWFNNLHGIGSVKKKIILEKFENVKDVFTADAIHFQGVLKEKDIETILNNRNKDTIKTEYEKMKKAGVEFISVNDKKYPSKLKQTYDYPYGLYYKGRFEGFEGKTVAIVGARECSRYGFEMAKYIATHLARHNIMVISGMAKGIDRAAHLGSLEYDYLSCAVLGCGVDVCYPRENIEIYDNLCKRGVIISEHPIKTQPMAGFFPMRNRIISGLADAVIVIEARAKSGSLITVDQALEQGKEIFALPGRFGDELSKGTNELIKNGANIITDIEDLFEFFKISAAKNNENNKKIHFTLAENEKIVYSGLDLLPKDIGTIIEESGLDYDEIFEALLNLIMKGIVVENPKNYYAKTME